MSHSVRPIGLALTAILAYACGGGQTSEDEAPLCYASHPPPDSGLIRPLRNREWAELIIRNYREGQSASQDCVGDSIQWHATPRECEVHEPDDEAPPEALELSDDSVVVGRTDRTTRKVVWVITHRFEDGDGFGPVVLAD
ncbi:MAG: hypothetical protein K8H88_02095, partial [Sandaracinaceae bacterium]|nr:hypothetical protein [Sandaracinaceae bacterium]